MSQPFDLPAAPPKGSHPKPSAPVPAQRAAARPATARLAPQPCSCGKRFQTKAALAQHRRDAPAHKPNAPERAGVATSEDGGARRRCDRGRNVSTDSALPRPFHDKPAMVLVRRLDEAAAVPALAEALAGLGVVAERDAGGGAEACVLCECGRVFGGWAEMYGHLQDAGSAAVHKPGGQVAAYSGKVWKDGEVGEGRGERAISVEDQNRGASVVAQERAVLSCCGRTFKHANAMRSHQRDSPKHNQTMVVARNNQELLAALAQSPTGADYRKLNGPTFNSRLTTSKHPPIPVDVAPVRCTCGKTFKHSTALTAHQRDSPKHSKPTTGPKERSTGTQNDRRGGGGSSSNTSSSSGPEYSYRRYGYNHANYFGGGEDWSLCDKDCGWCGHCMDNVDVYWDD